MNIVFKDWRELPRFGFADDNPIDDPVYGRWSYRNGGFKNGDTGTWYIVNIKPSAVDKKYDYIYHVYQLPPTICYVVNSMIAESHNEVLDLATGGLPMRMNDDGLGYVNDGKEEIVKEEDLDESEKGT